MDHGDARSRIACLGPGVVWLVSPHESRESAAAAAASVAAAALAPAHAGEHAVSQEEVLSLLSCWPPGRSIPTAEASRSGGGGMRVDVLVPENSAELGFCRWDGDGHYVFSQLAPGPPTLGQLVSYVRMVEAKSAKAYVTMHVSSGKQRASGAVLAGAFMVLALGWSAESAWEVLSRCAANSGAAGIGGDIGPRWDRFPPPFAKDKCATSASSLTVLDCLAGLEAARDNGWMEGGYQKFDVKAWTFLRLKFDASWLIPGEILAFGHPALTAQNPRFPDLLKKGPRSVSKDRMIMQHLRELAARSLEQDHVGQICSPKSWEQKDHMNPICSPVSFDQNAEKEAEDWDTGEEVPVKAISSSSFRRHVGITADLTDAALSTLGLAQSPAWSFKRLLCACDTNEVEDEVVVTKVYALSDVHERLEFIPKDVFVTNGVTNGVGITTHGNHEELKTPLHNSTTLEVEQLEHDNFVSYLDRMSIGAVVRLSLYAERLQAWQTTPYEQIFEEAGIMITAFEFTDATAPSWDLVRAFIWWYKKYRERRKKMLAKQSAIAIHCMCGLGRTGALIGAYAVESHNISGTAFHGWSRLCRPGTVQTPEQEHFLRNWLSEGAGNGNLRLSSRSLSSFTTFSTTSSSLPDA